MLNVQTTSGYVDVVRGVLWHTETEMSVEEILRISVSKFHEHKVDGEPDILLVNSNMLIESGTCVGSIRVEKTGLLLPLHFLIGVEYKRGNNEKRFVVV